jgi:tetratricopeptide (TPR) repeat protein
MVVILVGLTLLALWKRPVIGYLGMWYFIILAPTSTIMPIKDVIFEHRMYLPLAAPLCLLVLGFYQWAIIEKFAPSKKVLIYGLSIIFVVAAGLFMPLPMLPWEELKARQGVYFLSTAAVAGLFVLAYLAGKSTLARIKDIPMALAIMLAMAVVCVFAGISFTRNYTYKSAISVWQDVADKRPENPRAHSNLGVSLIYGNSTKEGIGQLRRAIECDSTFVDAYYNMGVMLSFLKDPPGSMDYYRKATEIDPKYTIARYNLAAGLANSGRLNEAIDQYSIILKYQPEHAMAMVNLATIYTDQHQIDKAIPLLENAIKLEPRIAESYKLYAACMDIAGKPEEAAQYRDKAKLAPNIGAPADDPLDVIYSVIMLVCVFIVLPILVVIADEWSNAINSRSAITARASGR